MRINFDFTDLEAFLVVKETGSFHLAAEKLNMSQSAVTRRIQKLETALGSQLFERSTRHVRPTLAAKRLQERAETMLDAALETSRAMKDESAASARQRARVVTIASIPTVLSGLLLPAIARLDAGGAAPRVRLLDLAANEVAEAVSSGDADLGLCSIPTLEPATEFELLFNDPIVLAAPVGHRLLSNDVVRWSALEAEPLILPARGTGNRLIIDETLARTETPIRWRFEVGRSTSAIAFVSAGAGVAPLPLSALDGANRAKLAWRPLAAPEVSRPIGLLSRIGREESPLTRALKDAIRDAARAIDARERMKL